MMVGDGSKLSVMKCLGIGERYIGYYEEWEGDKI